MKNKKEELPMERLIYRVRRVVTNVLLVCTVPFLELAKRTDPDRAAVK